MRERSPFTTFGHRLSQPRRLVCFPGAGGGENDYRDWAGCLPGTDVIGARAPGRGSRYGEPGHHDFQAMLAEFVRGLEAYAEAPLALFGHSLGGLFAFEAARRLAVTGRPPTLLIIAGCAAPGVIARAPKDRDLSPSALRAELVASGAVPPQLLADEQLSELAVQTLRADLVVQRSYRLDPAVPSLARPARIYYGRDEAADPERLAQTWAEVVSGPVSTTGFAGDHFFVNSARPAVLAAVRADLELWTPA